MSKQRRVLERTSKTSANECVILREVRISASSLAFLLLVVLSLSTRVQVKIDEDVRSWKLCGGETYERK